MVSLIRNLAGVALPMQVYYYRDGSSRSRSRRFRSYDARTRMLEVVRGDGQHACRTMCEKSEGLPMQVVGARGRRSFCFKRRATQYANIRNVTINVTAWQHCKYHSIRGLLEQTG